MGNVDIAVHNPAPHILHQFLNGVISPLKAKVYLNEVERMLERAKVFTRCGK